MNSEELKQLLDELNTRHSNLPEELYYIKKIVTILLERHILETELDEEMIRKIESECMR